MLWGVAVGGYFKELEAAAPGCCEELGVWAIEFEGLDGPSQAFTVQHQSGRAAVKDGCEVFG